MNRVAIIGAGQFGMALAESLSEAGVEVLLVERNGNLVQAALNVVSSAVQGDATNARALEDAGLKECDVAVVAIGGVAIGGNVEASLLATANCKELGVPTVISKASSELHGRILKKIGADQVIFPDRESAYRLARSVMDSEAAADDKQTDESDLATKNTEVTKS